MPFHSLVLMLTQAKLSLLIATTSDHCGLSINFLQKPNFLLVHTAHLWYTGMGAAPVQKRPRKSSERLLSGGIHLPGVKTQEPSSSWGPQSTTHGQQ